MDRVAIGVDHTAANRAVFILYVMRFLGGLSSPTNCFFKGVVCIIHFQRDIAHAIAMLAGMVRRHIVRRHGRSQNEVRLALTQRIRLSLALARFEPAVSNLRKPEALAIEVRCLPCIADPEFDMVNAFKLEWVLHPRALPDSIFAYRRSLHFTPPAKLRAARASSLRLPHIIYRTSTDTSPPPFFPTAR